MKSRAMFAPLLWVALLVAACTNGSVGPGEQPATPSSSELGPSSTALWDVGRADVVATNLKAPWGIALLPDGSALVTERDTGWVWQVSKHQAARRVSRIAGVSSGGEGGLLGIALSPRFATDHHVFLYQTAAGDSRIVRYRFANGGMTDRTDILTGIPQGPIHNGGRLAFGPDGYLYAGTGDAAIGSRAQDWASLAGKILRITIDGKPAPGNPRKDSPIWTLGHRNVEGLAWDSQGRLFASELGQDSWDELNLIQSGRNYGWPVVEGMAPTDMADGGFTDPLVVWPPVDASPSGIAISGNAVFVAALRGESLWLVPLEAAGPGEPVRLMRGQFGRLRDVAVDTQGDFWLLNSNTTRGNPSSDDDRVIVLPRL